MKALCIKDGVMTASRVLFCKVGKIYQYKTKTDAASWGYPYEMKSDSSDYHQMNELFFFTYFQPMDDLLDEKLFEI